MTIGERLRGRGRAGGRYSTRIPISTGPSVAIVVIINVVIVVITGGVIAPASVPSGENQTWAGGGGGDGGRRVRCVVQSCHTHLIPWALEIGREKKLI